MKNRRMMRHNSKILSSANVSKTCIVSGMATSTVGPRPLPFAFLHSRKLNIAKGIKLAKLLWFRQSV